MDRLREDGSTIVLTTHYLEEAQQRADRIGLMHKGTFHREGTVAELTRTLPAAIRFSLRSPPRAAAAGQARGDGKLPHRDLRPAEGPDNLLRWAQDHAVELRELQAGPTRLDDVFRALGSDQTTLRTSKKGTFAMLSIALSELVQIFRNRLVLVTCLVMPVGASARTSSTSTRSSRPWAASDTSPRW